MDTKKKILVIDCNACGAAGDMLLAALLDLGANVERVITAIKTLGKPEFGYDHIDISVDEVMRGEFRATRINVISSASKKRRGDELIDVVEKAAANILMSNKAREFASKTIRTLIETETKLHKSSFEDTHLHEVALVDTAAEIIGCAVALDDLGLFDSKIYSTPLAVGGGLVKFSHGTVSVPAPATLAILAERNFAFHGGPIENELATPTGAAILVNLVNEVTSFYPSIVPIKTGFGTGTKEFGGVPTILRVTVGNQFETEFESDNIAVIETNIDDTTGEILGYTIDKLLNAGAKDVSIIPVVAKKNRPGQIVKVIADQKDVAHLSKTLIAQTGTLGVRVYYCQRHISNREDKIIDLTVDGIKQSVNVKISAGLDGEVFRVKPEYEDLKLLAEKTGKPLRELIDLVTSRTYEMFSS